MANHKMSNPTGHIITASISSLRHFKCDEIWQITRANNNIEGTLWVPELAPSLVLFKLYLTFQNCGEIMSARERISF
jgi:hypothetical protein